MRLCQLWQTSGQQDFEKRRPYRKRDEYYWLDRSARNGTPDLEINDIPILDIDSLNENDLRAEIYKLEGRLTKIKDISNLRAKLRQLLDESR